MASYDYQNYPIKLTSTDTKLWQRYSKCEFLEGSDSDVDAEREGKVLVSENFSSRFNLHRGDVLKLKGKHGERDFEVGGVIVDYTSDIGTVLMEREIYKQHWGDDRVDTFELHLTKGADAEAIRRQINEHYGASYDLFVLTNAEFRAELLDAADAIFAIMRIIEYITLVVAALGVINAVFANILDRIREIGVLRALGMRRVEVGSMIVLEATLVGLVGVTAGALTGAGLGFVLIKHVATLNTGWHFPYALPWRAIGQIAVIVLPISAIAGYYPARHASRLHVREALGHE
jgi:putative ABC transport system permease protein